MILPILAAYLTVGTVMTIRNNLRFDQLAPAPGQSVSPGKVRQKKTVGEDIGTLLLWPALLLPGVKK